MRMTIEVESNKTPPGARVWQDIARVRRFEGLESARTIDGGPYGDTLPPTKIVTLRRAEAGASRRPGDA